MHCHFGGTVLFYACFIFVLGVLVKQCTECCLNCSTVTEGPREETVSLWFMQLGLNGRVSFLFLDCFLSLMVDHPGSGASWESLNFPGLLLAPCLGRILVLMRLSWIYSCVLDLQLCTTK